MTRQRNRTSLYPNLFGGLGYLSVITQWLWTTLILLPSILGNQMVKDFIMPAPSTQQTTPTLQFDGDSLILTGIAVIFTILVLVVTVIILIRLPFKLVEASKKTVDTTVRTAVPLVAHHRRITPKEQRVLSVRLKIVVKLLSIGLPPLILLSVFLIPAALDTAIVFLIAACFGMISLMWFGLQYGLAYILSVKRVKLI